MPRAIRILIPLLILPFFTHCGSKSAPDSNAVTGPFDSSGNYREDWVDKPDKWYKPNSKPKKKKKSAPVVVKKKQKPLPPVVTVDPSVARPRTTVTEPTVQAPPRPKPVIVKPKPKPKPKAVSHRVKKGDTLTKLSRIYGTSVTSIRSANNLRGDLIKIGQVLKIPR